MVATSNVTVIRARVVAAVAMGVIAQVSGFFLYSILFLVVTFQETSYIPYDKYFQYLPKTDERVIDIVVEKDTEVLMIIGDDPEKQVEIYVPEKTPVRVKNEATKYATNYKKSPKKAKQMKFEDFRRNDPVLSQFSEGALEEFDLPEKNQARAWKRLEEGTHTK